MLNVAREPIISPRFTNDYRTLTRNEKLFLWGVSVLAVELKGHRRLANEFNYKPSLKARITNMVKAANGIIDTLSEERRMLKVDNMREPQLKAISHRYPENVLIGKDIPDIFAKRLKEWNEVRTKRPTKDNERQIKVDDYDLPKNFTRSAFIINALVNFLEETYIENVLKKDLIKGYEKTICLKWNKVKNLFKSLENFYNKEIYMVAR